MKLAISYSPTAAAILEAMRNGAAGTQQAVLYDLVRDIIKNIIAESALAFLPQHRLKDDLAGLFRIKKGRLRIFYIASSTKSAAVVLFIGYRKEGDKRDAYTECARHLRRGTFDPQFAELGVNKPS